MKSVTGRQGCGQTRCIDCQAAQNPIREGRNGAVGFDQSRFVGGVGNGKGLDFVQRNLAQLGCTATDVEPGVNARRLAAIAGATALCGELSLLAAQTNPGELMAAHLKFER